MPIASVEYGSRSLDSQHDADAYLQETLTLSLVEAEGAITVTSDHVRLGVEAVRIAADTACYVAVGTAPDPAATTRTTATTARRFLPANTSLVLPIHLGEKVSVIGIA